MELTNIDHIGIAVKSLDDSIPLYEKLLDIKCYAKRVKTAFFLVGETKIELLESTDPDGPISSFIEKRGEGIHHLAFGVEDVNDALMKAKESGFALIDRKARKGAEEMNIGFLHPKSTQGILIELCSE